MNRQEIMLAALASGLREDFSPVQIQKLMFLIDRNIGSTMGGPFFDFKPYDYGPFDADVYHEFSNLVDCELGEFEGTGRNRRYRLNEEGRLRSKEILDDIPEQIREYIKAVASFVQKLSFTALVSTIYKHYPEMKTNSVFRG